MDDQQTANPTPSANPSQPQTFAAASAANRLPGAAGGCRVKLNAFQAPSGLVAEAPPQAYQPPMPPEHGMPAPGEAYVGQQSPPFVNGQHNRRLPLLIAAIMVCLVGVGIALFIFLKPTPAENVARSFSGGTVTSTQTVHRLEITSKAYCQLRNHASHNLERASEQRTYGQHRLAAR